MTRKFRWSIDGGATWTEVSASLPYTLPASTAGANILIEALGEAASLGQGASAAVHMFLVAGQSNSSGRAPDLTGTGYPAGTMEWRDGAWAEIGPRLYHGALEDSMLDYYPDTGANFGFDRSFATAYLAANPGVSLYLVGAGAGGTGFVNGDWAEGGEKRQICFDRIAAALAGAPAGAVFKGVLWNQGENDGQSEEGRNDYLASLSGFISDFRAQIADVPFVVAGQMLRGMYFNSVIQNTVQSLPNVIARVGYADISSPVEAAPDTVYADNTAHYSTEATENLGPRYLAGLIEAEANTALPDGSGTIRAGTAQKYDLGSSSALVQQVTVDIGEEAADRLVLAAVITRDNLFSYCHCNGLSINGADMMRAGEAGFNDRVCNVALFYGKVSGAGAVTAEVSISELGGALTGASVIILPVFGARPHLASREGFVRSYGGSGYGASISGSVGAQAGDLVFAASSTLSPTIGTGTLNLANQTTARIGSSNMGASWGFELATSAGSRTITNSFAGATNNFPSLAAMVLRPA